MSRVTLVFLLTACAPVGPSGPPRVDPCIGFSIALDGPTTDALINRLNLDYEGCAANGSDSVSCFVAVEDVQACEARVLARAVDTIEAEGFVVDDFRSGCRTLCDE